MSGLITILLQGIQFGSSYGWTKYFDAKVPPEIAKVQSATAACMLRLLNIKELTQRLLGSSITTKENKAQSRRRPCPSHPCIGYLVSGDKDKCNALLDCCVALVMFTCLLQRKGRKDRLNASMPCALNGASLQLIKLTRRTGSSRRRSWRMTWTRQIYPTCSVRGCPRRIPVAEPHAR